MDILGSGLLNRMTQVRILPGALLKGQSMPKIKIPNDKDSEGFGILLRSDFVVYSEEKGVYIVPQKSVDLLKKANIEFEVLNG